MNISLYVLHTQYEQQHTTNNNTLRCVSMHCTRYNSDRDEIRTSVYCLHSWQTIPTVGV